MKIVQTTTLAIAMLLTTLSSYAIDRNADMIDALRINYNSFERSDHFGVHITGENLVPETQGKWAILAGVSGGELSLDNGPDFDTIGIEIGVKYYVAPLTSVALLGGYTWSNGDTMDFEHGSLTTRLKQRFSSADNPVSPYLKLEMGGQFYDTVEDYDVFLVRAMLGCDFILSKDFAFVFEGGVSESENLDDGLDPEDGWLLALSMQYYWE